MLHAEPEGGVAGPTETSAAGIAEAGHAETNPVDASASAMADHTGGPTGVASVPMQSPGLCLSG